jgi:multiple sugar transport system substrate-binding protein
VSTWGNDSRLKLTQQAVDAFTAANPDIKVSIENNDWTAYWDKLATMTAGNNSPDVIQMDESYIAAYGARDALLDLGKVNNNLDLSAMDTKVLDTGKVGGTLVGAPIGVANFSVAVNPEVLKKAGVSMPNDKTWTWDQFAQVAAQITGKLGSQGVYGLDGFGTGAAELGAWARQKGEEIWPTDGAGVERRDHHQLLRLRQQAGRHESHTSGRAPGRERYCCSGPNVVRNQQGRFPPAVPHPDLGFRHGERHPDEAASDSGAGEG